MNFDLDAEYEEISNLSSLIMRDHLNLEALKKVEESDEWFDRGLWLKLIDAGLIGISISEDVGGSGLDVLALACLLRSQGQNVAPIPLLPTLVASLLVDKFGTELQRNKILPKVIDGSQILTIAAQEYLNDDFRKPSVSFQNGCITGKKIVVEYAEQASLAVATVTSKDGPSLVLVDLENTDVEKIPKESTRGEPLWEISFNRTPAEFLGNTSSIEFLFQHLLVSLCATQLGVTETALKITASYTSEREQFGRPLATFQAVTQRLADQFINVGGIRLSTFSAAWRLSEGKDSLEDALIAKWWSSERATEVAHATQHCHGGMGVSTDYPLHRYTLWNKHITTSLGAGTQMLRQLGSLLAAS